MRPQAKEAVEAVVLFCIGGFFDCPQFFPASSVLSASSSGIHSSEEIHSDNVLAILLFYSKVFLEDSRG